MEKLRNRLFACGTAAFMLLSALPLQTAQTAFAAEIEAASRGDINGDGKRDDKDLAALTKLLGEHVETLFTDDDTMQYDITQDGLIDSRDRYALSQYLSGAATELPVQPGADLEENVTLKLTSASCFPGDDVQVTLSFVDWAKDIAAYDITVGFDTALKLKKVDFISGDCQYVAGGRSVKLSGLHEQDTLHRGDIAVLTFTADKEFDGEFNVQVEGANVFTSNYDIYSSIKSSSVVTVQPLYEPVSLKAAGIGSKSVSLKWDMPFTDQPITGYRVYRDVKMIAETKETSYLDTKLTTDTDYEYTVSAVTASGTETLQSQPLNVHTAAVKIASADFAADPISNVNSDLTVKLSQTAPMASMKLDFKDSEGNVTSDTVKLDGEDLGTISYHWDVSKVADGDYTVTVTVTDIDGTADQAEASVSVLNNPLKQVELEAEAGGRTAVLTWSLATEAAAVGYRVYRLQDDGKTWEKIADITARDTLSYTDSNLTAGKKYTYSVTSTDRFGQESAKSKSASVVPTADKTAPEITLFRPLGGQRVSGEIQITVSAKDENEVASVRCEISADEGKTWEKLLEAEGASATWNFNTADREDGVYQLRAMATDADKNDSNGIHVISLAFDNTAPEQVKNLRTVSVTQNSASIAWDNVADEDFSHFIVIYSDQTNVNRRTVKDTLGINLTSLVPDTQYTVTVYAVDVAGNAGPASEPFRFFSNSDTTPPTISRFGAPEFTSANSSMTVTVYASDLSAIRSRFLEYSQDQKEWKLLTSASSYADFVVQDSTLKEGTLYLRAYASDIYGNTGDPKDSPVITVTVDNTAPKAPSKVTGVTELRSNVVSWLPSASEDTIGYRVERAVGSEDADYSVIYSILADTQFTDSNVVADGAYYYRISAVDRAGNRSSVAKSGLVKRVPDTQKPVIEQCVLTFNQSFICEARRSFQVLATDDNRVKSITAACRCKETDAWAPVETSDYRANTARTELIVRGELPTSILTNDSVTVQVTASDEAGNTDVKEFTFAIDNLKAEIKDATVKTENNQVVLNWTCPDVTGVSGFYVYRKVGTAGTETCFASTKPVKGQTAYTVADTNLTTGGNMVYRIVAVMDNGNMVSVTLDPIKIQAVPQADLIYTSAQVLGASYSYDATGSKNADDIVNVHISFGDEAAADKQSVKNAIFTHTYAEVGTYEVTLTVTNASGMTDTKKVTVTVMEPNIMSTVVATVKKMDGTPAAGAAVYVDVGTEQQNKYYTDENGKVEISCTAGDHEFGVFGNGYLPATKTATLRPGAKTELEFSIVEDQLVTANFEVNRMTLEEIKAAGIDVSDPENCQIVKIDVQLSYTVTSTVTDHIHIYFDTARGIVVSSGGGSNYHYIVKAVSRDVKTVILMRIPVQAQFIKEFFKVDMIVMNHAGADFPLTDCTATLNLPNGLTLMDNTPASAPRVANIGTIGGGQEQVVSWIVRGDKNGTYNFSADFNGTLQPFNEPVSMTFNSDKPIRVYGQEAATITVNFDPVIRSKTLFAEVLVENNSPIDLYELSTDIGKVIADTVGTDNDGNPRAVVYQTRFTGTNGILKIVDDSKSISVLHPGEKFSVVYAIRGIIAQDIPGVYKKTEADVKFTSTSSNVKVQVQHIKIANENDPLYGIQFDMNSDYLFLVKNKKGKAIKNASVELYQNVSGSRNTISIGTTDERGRLVVKRADSSESFRVEIKAEGYKNFNEKFQFSARKSTYMETFVLNGDYRADDYSLTSSYIPYLAGYGRVNLLTGRVSLNRVEDFTFAIEARAENPGTKYELRQGNRVIKSLNANGSFMTFAGLTPNMFYKDEEVFIRIYTETGDYFDNLLGIDVTEIHQNPDGTIDPDEDPKAKSVLQKIYEVMSFASTMTLPVPEAVREYFGDNLDFTYNFPFIMDPKESKTKNGNQVENGTQPTVSYVIDKGKITLNIGIMNTTKFKIPTSPAQALKFTITLSLKGELDSNANYVRLTGNLKLSLGGTIKTPDWHLPGPLAFIYLTCYFGGGFEAYASIGYNHDFSNPEKTGFYYKVGGSAYISISPEVGFGDPKVVGGGVYGTMKLTAEAVFAEANASARLEKVELTGDAGVRAYAAGWVLADFKFWKGSVVKIYPRESGRPRLVLPNGQTVQEVAENADNYVLPSDDDLAAAGEWNGQVSEGFTEMQSGIAFDAQPMLISDGTNVIMVWNVLDAARGAANASYLVYSVYDPQSGAWTAPAPVDTNKNADSSPVLYAGEDGIRIAYMESAKVFTDEDEATALTEFAKQRVIKTAKFDVESGKFTEFRTLDVNKEGGIAQAAAFAQAADGTTYLFWRSNANDNFFGTDDSNMIVYAKETENGWGTPTVLAENLPQISGFAAGSNADGKPVCAYITGVTDEEGNTVKSLYTAGLSGDPVKVAEGEIASPTFAQIPGKDASGLVWYQDGKLYDSADLATAEELCGSATDRFAIAGDRILFVVRTEERAEIFSTSYDAEAKTFTAPVSIESDDNHYYESISMAQYGEDTLYAARCTEATFDDEGALSTNTALMGGILGETADICISEPAYSSQIAEPGKELPVKVTVSNDGTTAADKLTLSITNAAGRVIASDTQDVALASGASAEVTFAPVLPADFEGAVYQINVTAADADRTPDNNKAELDLSKTDLSVEAEVSYAGDTTQVTIFARNESNVPAAAIVHIKPNSAEEETLTLFSEEIAPHTSAYWQLDSVDMLGDKYHDFVDITVTSDTADADESNNSTCVIISKSGMDPYSCGDVNLDGEVGLEDAVLALKCYTRQVALMDDLGFSSTQRRCADVNKDGSVDITDAMTLLRYYVNCVAGTVTGNFTEYLAQEQNGGAKHESE